MCATVFPSKFREKFHFEFRLNRIIPPKIREQYSNVNSKIAFCLLFGWAVIEIVLCTIVLFTHEMETYESSFLNGLCEKKECHNFIENALYFRILASILLMIGAFPVS